MAIDTGGGHEDNRSSSSSSKENNNKNDDDKGDDGNSEIGRRRSDHHKIMMILSPAKTLDLTPLSTEATTAIVLAKATQPNSCNHPEKTRAIARAMKQKSPSELMKLLGISKTIGTTAFEYWKDFQVHDNKSDVKTANEKENDDEEEGGDGKPCIFCFSGIAYQGLQSSTCSAKELQWLQKSLRIVDPLYGVLRPLDIMQPYRLEMATKGLCLLDDDDNHNKHGTTKKTKKGIQQPIKLAEYWKVAVTKHLLEELTSPQHGESFEDQEGTEQTSQSPNTTTDGRGGGGGGLVNLASDEYSAAVDVLQFSTGSKKNKKKNNKSKDEEEEEKDSHGQTVHLVKVIFWEQGRVVTVHAKRARGLMARYIAHVQATTLDQIRNFQEEGYRFVASKSDEYTLVFDRNKDWKTKKKPSTVSSSSSSSNTTLKTQKRSASQALSSSESTSSTKTGSRRTRKSKSFKA